MASMSQKMRALEQLLRPQEAPRFGDTDDSLATDPWAGLHAHLRLQQALAESEQPAKAPHFADTDGSTTPESGEEAEIRFGSYAPDSDAETSLPAPAFNNGNPQDENAEMEWGVHIKNTFIEVTDASKAAQLDRELKRSQTDPMAQSQASLHTYEYQIPAHVAPPPPQPRGLRLLHLRSPVLPEMPAAPCEDNMEDVMWPSQPQDTIWQQPPPQQCFQQQADMGVVCCCAPGFFQFVPVPMHTDHVKKIIDGVQEQMEYYFSDKNLKQDKFFQEKMSQNEGGWLQIDDILNCRRIRKWKADWYHVVEAARQSAQLELSEDLTAIRRSDGKDLDLSVGKKQGQELMALLLDKAKSTSSWESDSKAKEAQDGMEPKATACEDEACGARRATQTAPRGSAKKQTARAPRATTPPRAVSHKQLPTKEELTNKEDKAAKEAAIARLCSCKSDLLEHCQEEKGCRLVQTAIEEGGKKVALDVAAAIRGNVKKLLMGPKSLHGNFVVQKLIEVLPPGDHAFVAEEIKGDAARVARHQTGCRGICRLLDFSPKAASTQAVVEELLKDDKDDEATSICGLSKHAFAHFVIQSILESENVFEEQKRRVGLALQADLTRMASHKAASYVVEKALKHCDLEVQAGLLKSLVEPERVRALAVNRGVYVLISIAERSKELQDAVREAFPVEWRSSEEGKKLEASKHGKILLQKLGLHCGEPSE